MAEPNDINKHSYWDLDFRQIEPGGLETQLIVRQSPEVMLLEVHMDRAFHQVGFSPPGWVTVGLPFTPTLQWWHGTEIESPGIVYFGTGGAFDGFSDAGFKALTLSVCERYFTQMADRVGLPIREDLVMGQWLPLGSGMEARDRLLAIGRELLHKPDTRFGLQDQEDLAINLASALTDGGRFEDRSAYSTRARAVRRALDHLEERADDSLSVGAICQATGVSWRTLDRGFRERFGIGPKAYLNRFRLGKVRSELLCQQRVASVADAANAWGFWHMGQFAKDYHKMFGELPSETLKGR